jgi:DnaJ-class molecular chaperone
VPPRRSSGAWSDPIDLNAPEHAWWARERPPEPQPEDPDDPYVILKVEPTATWEEIVSSYRRLARMWHPDGLRDPAPGERELCDDMIRKLNVAYTELRVRRGR